MGTLAIRLLGSLQVTLNGAPLGAFESDKARALLVYLAVEAGKAHRREQLAELLWPGQPEERARRNLSQALYSLRVALGDRNARALPLFSATTDTIQLNPAGSFWLDVAELSQLLEICEHHSHHLLETCQDCQERFQQAIALYRGDFLDGFTLQDSRDYEEWLLVTREHYYQLVHRAYSSLVASLERQGRVPEALQAARRLVELDPFEDAACQQLLRLLAASGQRSAALAYYQSFRTALQAELDLAPQAETTAIYERIRQRRGLEPARATRRDNLPASLSPLIGREAELAELQAKLLNPTCRLLTILGPGGVGKSRLALETGRGLMQRFADGVYLVLISPLAAAEAILPNVAGAIGLRINLQKAPLDQLQDYLREKELLLVLDGCEGPLQGAPLIVALLRAAPELKVLTTSRARLNVKEEQIYVLSGLECPASDDQEAAANCAAVRLFASGARRVRSGFALDPSNLPAVAQICNDVQGLPLAILLAAAWAEVLSPAEILAEMRASPDFLQAEWADLPPRQRSVRATFDYSWNMLDKDEQAVFHALCIFRGGFTHQAAVQVGGATSQQLRLLVDKSFLAPQAGGWYDIHALLRQFGLEKLSQTPAASLEAHRQHSAYYLGKLERWEADIKGVNQKEALAEMDAKINDLRPAWEWAAQQGDLESLVGGLEALCLYHELRARATEGKRLCQETAARVAQNPGAESLMAFLAARESRFCRLLGELHPARQRLNDVQTLLSQIPGSDRTAQQAQALVHLEYGEHVFTADLAATQEHLQRSLALYRQLGDAWHMAGVLNRLGNNRHLAGDYAESDRLSGEALELYQALGAAAGIASAQRTIVQTQFRLGNIDRALALMDEAIAFSQASGDQAQAALDLRTRAILLMFTGEFEDVIFMLYQALPMAQNAGNRREIAFIQIVTGMVLFMKGEYEPARDVLEKALERWRNNDFQRETASCLWSLGCISLVEGSSIEAQSFFQQSLALYRQVGHQDELSWAISMDAYCHILSGQLEQAMQRLVETLQIAGLIRGYFSALFALAVSALWLGAQGQAEKALQVYTLAAGQPVFAHSAWFHQVFDKNILAYTQGLSGEVAEATQERGRQRELWPTLEELLEMLKV